MYSHVLPSHYLNTGCLPDCLTLSVHLLCTHCECFVAISMLCVCRPVCSLCTRAWKHVPALVMLHSQEHPRCELSIQVRDLLWQMQMTVSWKYCKLSARKLQYCTLHVACTLNPSTQHNIQLRVSIFHVWETERETQGLHFGFFFYRLCWPKFMTLNVIELFKTLLLLLGSKRILSFIIFWKDFIILRKVSMMCSSVVKIEIRKREVCILNTKETENSFFYHNGFLFLCP